MKAVLVAFALVVVLGGCGGSEGNDSNDPRLDNAYAHDEYRINPPLGWLIDDNVSGFIFFLSPETDHCGDGDLTANINVVVEGGVDPERFGELIERVPDQFNRIFNGYELLALEQDEIDGVPVYWHSYLVFEDVCPARGRQLFFLDGEKVYTITATALEDTWADYESLFDASLRSFRAE